MTTYVQYVQAIRNTEDRIALKLGVWPRGDMLPARVRQVAADAVLAVLVKTLVDKGLITDADLQASLQAAQAEVWPAEPDVDPTPPPVP